MKDNPLKSSDPLSALRSLKDGWNGRSAPAPNKLALANAVQLLHALDFAADRVVADPDGGIDAYFFQKDGGYLLVACTNQGEQVSTLKRPATFPEVCELKSVEESVEVINAFLMRKGK